MLGFSAIATLSPASILFVASFGVSGATFLQVSARVAAHWSTTAGVGTLGRYAASVVTHVGVAGEAGVALTVAAGVRTRA